MHNLLILLPFILRTTPQKYQHKIIRIQSKPHFVKEKIVYFYKASAFKNYKSQR